MRIKKAVSLLVVLFVAPNSFSRPADDNVSSHPSSDKSSSSGSGSSSHPGKDKDDKVSSQPSSGQSGGSSFAGKDKDDQVSSHPSSSSSRSSGGGSFPGKNKDDLAVPVSVAGDGAVKTSGGKTLSQAEARQYTSSMNTTGFHVYSDGTVKAINPKNQRYEEYSVLSGQYRVSTPEERAAVNALRELLSDRVYEKGNVAPLTVGDLAATQRQMSQWAEAKVAPTLADRAILAGAYISHVTRKMSEVDLTGEISNRLMTEQQIQDTLARQFIENIDSLVIRQEIPSSLKAAIQNQSLQPAVRDAAYIAALGAIQSPAIIMNNSTPPGVISASPGSGVLALNTVTKTNAPGTRYNAFSIGVTSLNGTVIGSIEVYSSPEAYNEYTRAHEGFHSGVRNLSANAARSTSLSAERKQEIAENILALDGLYTDWHNKRHPKSPRDLENPLVRHHVSNQEDINFTVLGAGIAEAMTRGLLPGDRTFVDRNNTRLNRSYSPPDMPSHLKNSNEGLAYIERQISEFRDDPDVRDALRSLREDAAEVFADKLGNR